MEIHTGFGWIDVVISLIFANNTVRGLQAPVSLVLL